MLALQEKTGHHRQYSEDGGGVLQDQSRGSPSKRRSASVARPRQMAMALAKELTNHSLPEIGDALVVVTTTVLHACRKIEQLREESHDIKEDFSNLIRTLSS